MVARTFFCLCLGLSLAGIAFGQNSPSPSGQRGQGEVTLEQWKRRYLKRFRQLDKNGDGFISPEEFPLRRIKKVLHPKKGISTGGSGSQKPRKRPSLKTVFGHMDVDGDGKISREEWRGPKHLFGDLDQNGDGQITLEEAKQFVEKRRQRKQQRQKGVFEKLDKNGDGKISREEFLAPAIESFRRMDKNGDGKVSREEMREVHRKKEEKQMKRHFERFDRNKDGVLAPEEVPPLFRRRFQQLDQDGDGKISFEEFRKAVRKQRQRFLRRRPFGGRRGGGRRR